MAKVAVVGTLTAGITGWSRVALYGNPSTKVFVNGKPVLLLGSGGETHHKDDRTRQCFVLGVSSKVRIEGRFAAREGDPVSDGDILSGDGVSQNAYFG